MQKYINTVESAWPGFVMGDAKKTSPADGPKPKPPQGMGLAVSTMQAPEAAADTEHDLFFYATDGNIAAVKALLQAKANISERFDDGATALHVACERGHHELALALLEFDSACVDEADEDGQTPLHYAIDNNNLECACILVSHGANSKIKDSEDMTPLDYARPDQMKALNKYLDTEDDEQSPGPSCGQEEAGAASSLFKATFDGNVTAVEALLQAKANISERFDDGATALHVACERGHDKVVSALLEFDSACVDEADEDGQTPLHYAIDNHMMQCAHILISHGADLTLQDDDGLTPLDNTTADQREELEQYEYR